MSGRRKKEGRRQARSSFAGLSRLWNKGGLDDGTAGVPGGEGEREAGNKTPPRRTHARTRAAERTRRAGAAVLTRRSNAREERGLSRELFDGGLCIRFADQKEGKEGFDKAESSAALWASGRDQGNTRGGGGEENAAGIQQPPWACSLPPVLRSSLRRGRETDSWLRRPTRRKGPRQQRGARPRAYVRLCLCGVFMSACLRERA